MSPLVLLRDNNYIFPLFLKLSREEPLLSVPDIPQVTFSSEEDLLDRASQEGAVSPKIEIVSETEVEIEESEKPEINEKRPSSLVAVVRPIQQDFQQNSRY